MRQYIPKPYQLLDQIWKDRDVNIVEKSYILGRRKFNLIDLSLNGYGQQQDKKYIRSAFYRKNIRRGNTIIEDPKTQYCQFARKGTPKMLDIKLQYIQYFLKKKQLDKIQRNIAEIIFEGINQALQEGKKIQLIKTEKLNGENVQVSYNYQYNSWIICSKNVSILAKYPQDLKIYKQQRYNYALLMAEQWFAQIEKLNQEQIEGLKKMLDGFTAVGQYCGNPQYQHLVRYEQVGIRWFALVDNFSEEFCVNPLKAKKQFEKFGFKVARAKSIIFTSSGQNFYQALQKLYLKTAQAGLQDAQYGMQGSIVYFITNQSIKNGTKQLTVGGGKLKTLQYRYLRKIRQKLSRSITKKQKKQQLLKSYQKQIKQLQQSCSSKAPYPHEYYTKILSTALDLVAYTSLSQEKLRGNFISILKMIFYAMYKRISIKNYGASMLADEQFMDKVCEIPFAKYNGLGCNTKIVYIILCLPGMFKTYLSNKLATHFQKINVSYTPLQLKNTQKIQQDLRISPLAQPQKSPLQHYCLDGAFDSESLFNIVKCIRLNSDCDSFYKLILIRDSGDDLFVCSDGNQYPFRLETIIMCYYGQHRHMITSPRLQPKIDNLKQITLHLKKNANLAHSLTKLNLQQHTFPFSSKSKFQNLSEFKKIIQDILKAQDEKSQFNAYAMLILRLEKIQGLEYIGEAQFDNQVECLIKASYPSIPLINFKK